MGSKIELYYDEAVGVVLLNAQKKTVYNDFEIHALSKVVEESIEKIHGEKVQDMVDGEEIFADLYLPTRKSMKHDNYEMKIELRE